MLVSNFQCALLFHDWFHPRAVFKGIGFFFFLLLIYSAYAAGIKHLGKHLLYTHTNTHNAAILTLAHTRMCILSHGLIWFWDKIKLMRRIITQFRKIIMLSVNHCDRLRASTKGLGGDKRLGRAKSREAEGWVCHFVCPLISQSWS